MIQTIRPVLGKACATMLRLHGFLHRRRLRRRRAAWGRLRDGLFFEAGLGMGNAA